MDVFLFFGEEQLDRAVQLKAGLMALIELAAEGFGARRLVLCLQRNATGLQALVRDLGWVGFELITLCHWQAPAMKTERSSSFSSVSTTSSSVFSDDDVTSERWLFMGMEV